MGSMSEELFHFVGPWLSEHAGLVSLVLLSAIVSLMAVLLWTRGIAARRVQANRRLGEAGERAALKILKRAGYQIEECQAKERYQIFVDGKPHTVYLRADFIVKKSGKLFVAEAKGGTVSANIAGRTTRRQLLEYLYAFNVSGVLLVDVVAAKVALIEFPQRRS